MGRGHARADQPLAVPARLARLARLARAAVSVGVTTQVSGATSRPILILILILTLTLILTLILILIRWRRRRRRCRRHGCCRQGDPHAVAAPQQFDGEVGGDEAEAVGHEHPPVPMPVPMPIQIHIHIHIRAAFRLPNSSWRPEAGEQVVDAQVVPKCNGWEVVRVY